MTKFYYWIPLRENVKSTKPTKLTILKDKKRLLAEIDKAIEDAPERWFASDKLPSMIHFDIADSCRINIYNRKDTLEIFRKKVKGVSVSEFTTRRPSILKPYSKFKSMGKKPDISLEEEKWIVKEMAKRKPLKEQVKELGEELVELEKGPCDPRERWEYERIKELTLQIECLKELMVRIKKPVKLRRRLRKK